MKILQSIITLLCLVVVKSYLLAHRRPSHLTTARKPKTGTLTVEFCKNMQGTKLEPSLKPEEGSLWPWWFDSCDTILREDYLAEQKTKYIDPVMQMISTMQNKTELENAMKKMIADLKKYK